MSSSSFGLFESLATDVEIAKEAQAKVAQAESLAIESARSHFGEFLLSAATKPEIDERWNLISNEAIAVMAEHAKPVPRVIRAFKGSIKTEWGNRQAAWADGKRYTCVGCGSGFSKKSDGAQDAHGKWSCHSCGTRLAATVPVAEPYDPTRLYDPQGNVVFEADSPADVIDWIYDQGSTDDDVLGSGYRIVSPGGMDKGGPDLRMQSSRTAADENKSDPADKADEQPGSPSEAPIPGKDEPASKDQESAAPEGIKQPAPGQEDQAWEDAQMQVVKENVLKLIEQEAGEKASTGDITGLIPHIQPLVDVLNSLNEFAINEAAENVTTMGPAMQTQQSPITNDVPGENPSPVAPQERGNAAPDIKNNQGVAMASRKQAIKLYRAGDRVTLVDSNESGIVAYDQDFPNDGVIVRWDGDQGDPQKVDVFDIYGSPSGPDATQDSNGTWVASRRKRAFETGLDTPAGKVQQEDTISFHLEGDPELYTGRVNDVGGWGEGTLGVVTNMGDLVVDAADVVEILSTNRESARRVFEAGWKRSKTGQNLNSTNTMFVLGYVAHQKWAVDQMKKKSYDNPFGDTDEFDFSVGESVRTPDGPGTVVSVQDDMNEVRVDVNGRGEAQYDIGEVYKTSRRKRASHQPMFGDACNGSVGSDGKCEVCGMSEEQMNKGGYEKSSGRKRADSFDTRKDRTKNTTQPVGEGESTALQGDWASSGPDRTDGQDLTVEVDTSNLDGKNRDNSTVPNLDADKKSSRIALAEKLIAEAQRLLKD